MESNDPVITGELENMLYVFKDYKGLCQLLFLNGYSVKDFMGVRTEYGDEGTAWVLKRCDGTELAVLEVDHQTYKFIPVDEAGRRY